MSLTNQIPDLITRQKISAQQFFNGLIHQTLKSIMEHELELLTIYNLINTALNLTDFKIPELINHINSYIHPNFN